MSTEEKESKRKLVLDTLGQLPDSDRETFSRQALDLLLPSEPWKRSQIILLFSSTHQEPDTSQIATEALRANRIVLYPRSHLYGEMELRQVTDPSQLKKGRWGILEPDPEICPLVPSSSIDLALVPGVGFDRKGSRLGRGGGYYDRLLGNLDFRAITIGYFFSLQELSSVPIEPHDKKLDWILTERELFKLS